MKTNHNNFLNLAFNLAKINLGKTKSNPSVGCVVVKNNSVISSGYTSNNGRPHAEVNSLKRKIDFKNSDLYVTMEPCTHYGVTPPCTNIIKEKGIKKVYYAFDDVDKRTSKKSKFILLKNKIKTFKKTNTLFKDFYESYFLNKNKSLPLIDAKIALSKDYFTISKKSKWITNILSRRRVHLIRSEYEAILSTSKSINKDNSLLNCRLNGFNNNKPDLIIIDLNFKIKKNLDLFILPSTRKITIIINKKKSSKESYFKKKGVKFIKINYLNNKNDFIFLFNKLKKKGYNRILIETGLKFLNALIKKKLISNIYMFKSSTNLSKYGMNRLSVKTIKKIKTKNRIKVNLNNDELYKVRLNYV